MRAIDSNIAVRLLVRDDLAQARVAEQLTDSPFILLPTVLMEVAWVLTARYKLSRREIASRLVRLLGNENARIVSPEAIAWAILQVERGHDFADALHLALAANAGAATLATFDGGIDRLTDTPVPVELLTV